MPAHSDQLRDLLREILPTNRFYAAKYAGHDLHAEVPFLLKSELIADQDAHAPYGSVLTYPLEKYCRLHQTSGSTTGRPLRWLDTPESWNWLLTCWTDSFPVMGLTPRDKFFFPFSFGPFLGFWTAFEAATRAGYLCLAGGGMGSTARLRFLMEHEATVVCCTPTYALHLAELASKEGIDLASSKVRMLIVAGEPGGAIPATRKRIEEVWGARVFDHYGMTEVGPVAVEMEHRPGSMKLLETHHLAEIVEPKGTTSVAEGEVGELVLTNLGRLGSPAIRYRTGDLVRAQRIDGHLCLVGGILGRTDDMIHIRGNNVYPASIEAAVRKFPEVAEFRLVVDHTGSLTDLRIEIEAENPTMVEAVARAIRDEFSSALKS